MLSHVSWRDSGPRSLLFVPADRSPDLLPKAQQSGADGVIVDLEDAVSPSAKVGARDAIASAIARADAHVPILVRVNAIHTEWFAADVTAFTDAAIAGIVLPKCEDRDDVIRLSSLIHDASMVVIPMIESARGVLAAQAIAGADARVVGLAFGAEDLAAQMGVRRSLSGREVFHARSHVVLAALAAGVWALDSPCMDARGARTARREAALARSIGYSGKLLIHPAQVAPVHDGFRPTHEEVAEAERVLQAFDAMQGRGAGVGAVGGRMIDKPVAAAARRLLERAGLFEMEKEA